MMGKKLTSPRKTGSFKSRDFGNELLILNGRNIHEKSKHAQLKVLQQCDELLRVFAKGFQIEYTDRNLIKKIIFGGVATHNLQFLNDRTVKKLQAKYKNGNSTFIFDNLGGTQCQQGQIVFIHA